MNNYRLAFFVIFLASLIACKTEEPKSPPTVISKEVSEVTLRKVTLNGEVTDEGFSAAKDRGFVYSFSNPTPSFSDKKISSGNGKGTYSVLIDKLPINSKLYYRAFSTNSQGTSYSDIKILNTVTVVTVTSKTGKIWMDRNLGASQIATSQADEKAFGDLYQWGRGEDGHQFRNSLVEEISPTSAKLNNTKFISNSKEPFDWQAQKNDDSWQGENGANCPCPIGFRIPTSEEWQAEIVTWSEKSASGGFNSNLKLTSGGLRETDGALKNLGGSAGFYWASTSKFGNVNASTTPFYLSNMLYLTPTGASPTMLFYRVRGLSVRCIKN
jgi:uncharacterized protein (TIGR02145 family)